jgi:hypothetical protein
MGHKVCDLYIYIYIYNMQLISNIVCIKASYLRTRSYKVFVLNFVCLPEEIKISANEYIHENVNLTLNNTKILSLRSKHTKIISQQDRQPTIRA